MNEELLTVSEAAKRMDVHEDTIRRYCREGRLPAKRHLNGWSWLIPKSAVPNLAKGTPEVAA